MGTSLPDPLFRRRLIRSLALSMLISFLCGALVFLQWTAEHLGRRWTWKFLQSALSAPIATAALTFWTLFPILFFGYVRKSAATLEYQERRRLDEERWAASKSRRDVPSERGQE